MTPPAGRIKPDVMSPAGYWGQLRAAIEAGADAVYIGLKHFTARAKVGFSLGELPEAMQTLHRRGVKGFVTFNTLVFEHELREAARAIAAIAEAGADALIVQDVAILNLAKQIAPELPLHASTQMSVTSAEGAELACCLGVSRVTLARELSLKDIAAIRGRCDCELEIFVHGALCVAYSGQCFSSEAWGGRSANRGQCAQACRLPYELIVDGKTRPLGDARYLLSPGDLYALEQIPEIVNLGISALKIEGRYKDAEYVALTTRAYREAVDAAWQGNPAPATAERRLELEQVYSRGLGAYFLTGTNHQAVVKGRAPRHRGLLMGRVTSVLASGVEIAPEPAYQMRPLRAGDGVVFDAADWRSPEEPEEGGRLYGVLTGAENKLELRFANGAIQPARIRPGDLVWRTHDPALERAAHAYMDPAAPLRKQPLRVLVTAEEGVPLRTKWTVTNRPGLAVTVVGRAALGAARNRPLTGEFARSQLGRLGNTPFELAELQLEVHGSPFVPPSLLNELRHEAVEKLETLASQPAPIPTCAGAFIPPPRRRTEAQDTAPELHLLVRTPDQLEAALEARPASITLDYLDLYGLRPSVERVRAADIIVRVASPRILKPGEERIVDFLLGLRTELVVRSSGLLEMLASHEHGPLIGDFSLNAANSIAAGILLNLGLQRISPTHDLNAAQVADLARQIGGEAIEAIAYQHLPVFHTEHCVFCRFLSTGTSYEDCGRPCEKHAVSLRDSGGRKHPVMADVGCRNTVFGAEAQDASLHLESWRSAGIRHFRLEFAHEPGKLVLQIAQAFADAFAGRTNYVQLRQQLSRLAPQGITEGSLYVPANYLTLPVLQ